MDSILNKIQPGSSQDAISRWIIAYLQGSPDTKALVDIPIYLGNVRTLKDYESLLANHGKSVGGLTVLNGPYLDDCIRVQTGISIRDLLITDTGGALEDAYNNIVAYLNAHQDYVTVAWFKDRAHRDAIQPIPFYRYAGGCIDKLDISRNIIYSDSLLQAIFSSDGGYTNLSITGNYIDTRSEHQITMSGVFNGVISNNIHALTGKELIPQCYPLRLGGGTLNMHVLSLVGDKVYGEITGVSGTSGDLRSVPRRGTNIDGLDLALFRERYKRLPGNINRFTRIETIISQLVKEKKITTFTKN